MPIDWWLICALYSTALAPDREKLVKVVKDKAATKGLAPALLRAAVVGHGAALRPHLGAQLELATALVKAPAPAARLLGRKLYCVLFGEFDEYGQRQELLSLVLTHAGSGNAAEVDEALHALVDLAADDAAALAAFSPFLTTILDYVENHGRIDRVVQAIQNDFGAMPGPGNPTQLCLQALEVMLLDGWVRGRVDRKVPRIKIQPADEETLYIHWNRDGDSAEETRAASA